jgi:hypothetical protein
MRIPAREPINVATWLSLRFERGTRFSQSRLEQHPCGAWIVTGVNGRRNARLGRTLMTWSGFFEGVLSVLAESATRRRQRGYALAARFTSIYCRRRLKLWTP